MCYDSGQILQNKTNNSFTFYFFFHVKICLNKYVKNSIIKKYMTKQWMAIYLFYLQKIVYCHSKTISIYGKFRLLHSLEAWYSTAFCDIILPKEHSLWFWKCNTLYKKTKYSDWYWKLHNNMQRVMFQWPLLCFQFS